MMSVDEAGRSTVVLVPECYNDKDITKINFDCPSGAIDVITAAGIVTLTQPFQATMVENSYAPPVPCCVVAITFELPKMLKNADFPPASFCCAVS